MHGSSLSGASGLQFSGDQRSCYLTSMAPVEAEVANWDQDITRILKTWSNIEESPVRAKFENRSIDR